MTTTAGMIAETRRHLQSMARDELDRLTTGVISTDTTLTFDFDLGGIQRGAVLSLDFEMVYVWSASPTARTAVVQRGYLGTTAAAHATGTFVYVNPRFSDFAILQAINEELQGYSSPSVGLFRVFPVTFTYNPSRVGYDLGSGVIDIIEVRYVDPAGTLNYPRIKDWGIARSMPTTDFASGVALMLYSPGYPGRTVVAVCKGSYNALTTNVVEDVLVTSGLHTEAHDIPPIGAASRLVAPREIKRAFTESQPEPRAASEVPPGANRAAAGDLLARRKMRLIEEASRLSSQYPQLARI